MADTSRRDFLGKSMILAGAGSLGLVLPAGAGPTAPSGDLGSYGGYLREKATAAVGGGKRPAWNVTEDNILGPFHREGAPYRGKVTPPLEPGTVLLINGRVFAHDTRRPLASAVIDVLQANAEGRYDNDDPKRPPAANVFLNRARVLTDENGFYEYETIHPGPYQIGAKQWRPAHIHYWARATGYRELVTQLYFRGDMHQKGDPWIRDSLIIDLRETKTARGAYKTGAFDIILARRG